MVTDIELLLLLIATISGALTSAGLGWADAGGNFDIKKFGPSIVRAIVAALAVFVATYAGGIEAVDIFVYIGAFLIGMAIDAGGNRLSGAITGSSKVTG